MEERVGLVLIHGLFSSRKAWTPLLTLLERDPELAHRIEPIVFEYDSRPLTMRLARSIPDFAVLGASLATFVENECREFDRLIVVTHSQGGLVLQRFLAMMLADGKGEDLSRIRRIVMFACPNNGSELLLATRKFLGLWWRHPQERQLRPASDPVVDAQRRVLNGVVFAETVASDRCPIPVVAYAGESDGVVTLSSSRFMYPSAGVLPGDHHSVIAPPNLEDRRYKAFRSDVLTALTEPFPATPDRYGEPRSTSAAEVYADLLVEGPMLVTLDSGRQVRCFIQAGPIDQLHDVDVVVSSENVYFEMAKPFKPSTSGRLRRAAAVKAPSGEILDDCTFKELGDWMKAQGRHGLPVQPGTVVPTTSGEMRNQGVHRIYHAAVVTPELGTGRYSVDSSSISAAIRNILKLVRGGDAGATEQVKSVCIPLLGAGRAGLDPRVSLSRIWTALSAEMKEGDDWDIHFSTWWRNETSYVRAFLEDRTVQNG
ncbi:MAG: alpha/beta fold hydrolase [Cellulomonas sp.]